MSISATGSPRATRCPTNPASRRSRPSALADGGRSKAPAENRVALLELVASRESVRGIAADGGPFSQPGQEIGLGPGLFADPPAQAVAQGEELDVRRAAVPVLLQHDAAAAGHLGDL